MKNKLLKIVLPFFPENSELKKHLWHKVIKIVTIIVTATSIYTMLWMITLFFILPKSWMDSPLYPPIYHASYQLAYLPMNITNLLSRFPIYGILFHSMLSVPIIGPIAFILILITALYFAPSLMYRLSIYLYHNFHFRKVKITVLLISLGIIFFVSYLWKFQQVVTEGSLLIDEHCIRVYPLIIDRKIKYTEQYNLLIAQASEEQYMDALDKYRQSATAYTNEEWMWLAKQKMYLDSQDFNQLIPDYMREAANHQYNMFEAEYLSTSYLLQDFEESDKNKQDELVKKVMEEINRSNAEQDKYNAVWEREKGSSDWRFYFASIPPSKCPSENSDFPEVPNPFAPPPIPLDPNAPLS